MSSELTSIKKYDATAAEAKRVEIQGNLETHGQASALIAKVADLKLCSSFVIPLTRSAEFDGATDADKIRFCLVALRAARRNAGDFLTVFEDEYLKEFV